jgi:hypothetical protein
MTTATAPTKPSTDRGGSLGSHFRRFWRFPTPRVIAALATAAIVFRLTQGPPRLSDFIVGAGILAAQPLTEWLIHVFVLHAKPKRIFGRAIDLSPARGHREHHEDPSNLDLVFVPPWAFLYVTPITTALILLFVRPWHLAATVLMVSELMLLMYEWTHYLIHTNYKPRRKYYRHLWRNHRLHHYRNEHYWFGVTVTLGDKLLRTSPKKSAVPVSPTARTLGREPAESV